MSGSLAVVAQEPPSASGDASGAPTFSGEDGLEPEVTIRERDEETHYEYRINGQLYMVKVQPSSGPAYYLVDSNGDGELDMVEDDPTNISVPRWVIFRW